MSARFRKLRWRTAICCLLICLGLILAGVLAAERNVTRVVLSLAQAQARALAVQILNEAAAELVSAEKIQPQIKSMLGDDFAEYRRIAPCCYVQVGMYNEEKGCTAAHHHGLFKVDEDVLPLCCAWMASCARKAAQA